MRVSDELRTIETVFDNAYRFSPLVSQNYPTALWNLLSAFEDRFAEPILRGDLPNYQRNVLQGNLLINALKHPVRWLSACPTRGQLRRHYDAGTRDAAHEFLSLGGRYIPIETMYTLASRRLCDLRLEVNTVVPSSLVGTQDARYYAYNRFVAAGADEPALSPELIETLTTAGNHTRITPETFEVRLTNELVTNMITAVGPIMDQRFDLPTTWRTTSYSFGEFKAAFTVLYALSALQTYARTVAAARGVLAAGYKSAVMIYALGQLRTYLQTYTGLPPATVRNILRDLTYGERGASNLDPALQPLIPILNNQVLIAPSLIQGVAPERNLCVLLNAIPAERALYSRLVDQKEGIMRDRITTILHGKSFRTFAGRIPGESTLPDIDLAIIDDARKIALLLELKWFIGPDEISEVLNRIEELRKGIDQIQELNKAWQDGNKNLQTALEITGEYQVNGLVISENYVGLDTIQIPTIPLIAADHLLTALEAIDDLRILWNWLHRRSYLPIENKHFTVVEGNVTIDNYKAIWYDIRPLVQGVYYPSLPGE